jgi:hypothetical protein
MIKTRFVSLVALVVFIAMTFSACNTVQEPQQLSAQATGFPNTNVPVTDAQVALLAQTITSAEINAALNTLGAAPGANTTEAATIDRLRTYKQSTGQTFVTVKGLAIRIPGVANARALSPATTYPTNYCTTNAFPAQWNWTPPGYADQPKAATSGTPLIKQIRNGQLIATYTQFGYGGSNGRPNMQDNPDTSAGAFHRSGYQNWKDGDLFEVYPAVYQGEDQQPWLGEGFINDADYSAGKFNVPKNITIRGITVNGVRPVIKLNGISTSNNTLGQSAVYFDKSENIVFENIDIDGGGAIYVGKAGVYLNGAKNLTLRNLRIHGFKGTKANGIFGTGSNSGLLRLENIELFDNGGDNGPEHNIYLNRSSIDPNFTVYMRGSWSHDAFYGHLFKSRAQRNILEGNYFMGTKSAGGVQTENYLVDIPEGGTLVMRNNVLVKNFSGDNSNGIFVTFAGENTNNAATNRILIENNTFTAFAKYYDTQNHPLFPYLFYYPLKTPGTAGFPSFPLTIRNNAYVGFCKTGNAALDYRGSGALELNHNQIDTSFRLRTPRSTGNFATLGTIGYEHYKRIVLRATLNVGARD